MAGKRGDNRERDMQLPEHLRTKLMELYAQWDEVLAALRKQAAIDGVKINNKIAQARRAFDEMRSNILYGYPRVAQLELHFQEYDQMIKGIIQKG